MMKFVIRVSFLALVSMNVQAQKRALVSCGDVERILASAQNEFKDILGEFETKESDCNYYYSKVSYGIDSTTTLQSCKGHEGHLILHFDTYIGSDDIQSDLELKALEDALDHCLPTAKIKEIKPGDFKRIVQYKVNGIQLTVYQDKVKTPGQMSPLVTVSVIKIR